MANDFPPVETNLLWRKHYSKEINWQSTSRLSEESEITSLLEIFLLFLVFNSD